VKKNLVHVRELSRWGLDSYPYRPESVAEVPGLRAVDALSGRAPVAQMDVLLAAETLALQDEFSKQSSRTDLLDEMQGLDWSLGVIDLRPLIAFQRRLTFRPDSPTADARDAHSWASLFSLCFGSAKPANFQLGREEWPQALNIYSSNPNLHLRTLNDSSNLLAAHSGGPFFEVASYRDRWFLRDGYHRAYSLLARGITAVPAVIVKARTLEELGADQPWFFPEDVLFSDNPPRVIDFLNDDLVLQYSRPALHKTIRITIEEILTPITSQENTHEHCN
jgi:hypothetical protein